jgi:hypothetical protein
MKKNYIIYSVLFLAVSVAFSGCTGLKKMKKKQGLITYQQTPKSIGNAW